MAMPQRGNTIEAIKRLEPPSRVRYGRPPYRREDECGIISR